MIIASIALAAGLMTASLTHSDLKDPFGIAWSFLYDYKGVPGPLFMPELRSLGGQWTKIYLIWNQIEPKRGEYDWTAIDRFVGQLKSPEEGLISVFSTSSWATRTSAEILPPSPAKDPADYDRFIRALVKRCKGRVRYFQNDSEASNPIYWSGTAAEFATETRAFSKAVRETDPHAKVILGGYDGLFNPGTGFKYPTQDAALAFFRQVLNEAQGTFDYFDVRLYADPNSIPARVAYLRKMMADNGGERPILCTEYNGPGFFEFRENLKYVPLVTKWSAAVASQGNDHGGDGVADLYKDVSSLAPQTKMFLQVDDPELEAKLARLQCRDLVERNVYALSAGVRRTMFWDLWHDTSERNDVMALMYGKLKMVEYANGKFGKRYPPAEAFLRMTTVLRGVKSVRPITVPDAPKTLLFEADCGPRGKVLIAWRLGVPFAEEPADTELDWAWPSHTCVGLDAIGAKVPVQIHDGRISLKIGATPVFLSEK